MKIIALTSFAGVAISCSEGEVYDLPEEMAKQFIKEGLAAAAKPETKPAAKPAPTAKSKFK